MKLMSENIKYERSDSDNKASLENERNRLGMLAMRYDIEEIKLNDELIETLYKLIGVDKALSGGAVSKITENIVSALGYRLLVKDTDNGDIEYVIKDKRTGELIYRSYVSMFNNDSKKDDKAALSRDIKEGERIALKIRLSDRLTDEQKKQTREDIEHYLYDNGARYEKYTIKAEDSKTGREINGRNWYITYHEGMDLSIFGPYLKDKSLIVNNRAADEDQEEKRQYLFIPPGPRSVFDDTIALFKDNGAIYDPRLKRWYLVGEYDKDKFKDFIKPYTEEDKKHLKDRNNER